MQRVLPQAGFASTAGESARSADRPSGGHRRAAQTGRPLRRTPRSKNYKIRLNQSSDSPADSSISAAAPSAKRAEISVSFFSTVSRELSVW